MITSVVVAGPGCIKWVQVQVPSSLQAASLCVAPCGQLTGRRRQICPVQCQVSGLQYFESFKSLQKMRKEGEDTFLFNLKSFVTSEKEAAEFLGASSRSSVSRRTDAEVIPQSGQIQNLIADILIGNNVTDMFHVNLFISPTSNTTRHICSDCAIPEIEPSGQKLEWLEGDTSPLDIQIYQDGTGESLGNCGQFQAADGGSLSISSNNCSVKLKPLCLRRSSITLTEVRDKDSLRRWKSHPERHISTCDDGGDKS